MNPLRAVGTEPTPWVIIALGVVIVLGVWAERVQKRQARERRGQDGGRGYHPADLREGIQHSAPQGPEERWLLGLAAPIVEECGLLHDRWDLTPPDRDAAWTRHFDRWLESYGARGSASWNTQIGYYESMLRDVEASDEPDNRPYLVAQYAFIQRLGAAQGLITNEGSRSAVHEFALPLRGRYADWFGFADAYLAWVTATEPRNAPAIRAKVRILYAPGGPWADVSWS